MKLHYETPKMNLLPTRDDVITTSNGLETNDIYDPAEETTNGAWGNLWG